MPEITIAALDGGQFDAYLSLPKATSNGAAAPCVIVIQEIFGVNKGIREKCDWLASEGFIACAPDLFWRIEKGIELSDQVPTELERAFELFGLFDIDKGIEDIRAVDHTLRGHAYSNGKVGTLGYCLGGKLAYLAACHSNVSASISYYGVGIEQLMADANNMKNPFLMHMAEEDGFVPKDAQMLIHQGLQDNDNVTIHSYPQMDHAFTRVGGDSYNAEAAATADQRSLEFLKNNLS